VSRNGERGSLALTIRQLRLGDIRNGFLDSLDNLIPGTSELDLKRAKQVLRLVQRNRLHKVFVASTHSNEDNNPLTETVVGTTTLLVEPKFIFSGRAVGHIEDVSVRKGYEKMGIGAKLVSHATEAAAELGCVKVVLDCSTATMPFYEKLGYEYQDNCMRKMLSDLSA
jgi:glucosamine-phosphate N-acetyltransferase